MVKEVNQMEIEAQVHAYGEGRTAVVECTLCGPLGTCMSFDVFWFATEHFLTHEAKVTQ